MSDKLNKTLTMNNVQKKGTRVGIYTLTTHDRKRGVVRQLVVLNQLPKLTVKHLSKRSVLIIFKIIMN